MNNTTLARKNLDKRLTSWRSDQPAVPSRGWTRAIREALGMTTRQLAARMGAVPSRITAIEKAELTGSITVKSLREVAEAMNCTFVYAFVPTKPLDDILVNQAEKKIEQELSRLNHTMSLENQALTASDLKDERKRLLSETLAGSLRGLWDTP